MRNATFFVPQGERRPYWRISAERIRLERPPAVLPAELGASLPSVDGSLVWLSYRDNGFEVSFRGSLSRAKETAQGSFVFKAPAGHPAAAKITAVIAPWEQGRGVSLAGELKWSGAWASLDSATITFGDRSAKGSLTVANRHGRRLLEGTLAYDNLEWMPAVGGGRCGCRATPYIGLCRSGTGAGHRPRHADIRRAFPGRTLRGWAARTGAVGASGPLQHRHRRACAFWRHSNGQARLRFRASSIAFPECFWLPVEFAGPDRRFGLAIQRQRPRLGSPCIGDSFKGSPAAADIRAATGRFAIDFPAGGALEGDISRNLSTALSQREILWGLGSSSFAFTAASMRA